MNHLYHIIHARQEIEDLTRFLHSEVSQHFFEIFREGEEELCIAGLARWNTQLEHGVGNGGG